jgi:ABC-2 type transport system ATP-binding protein
VSADEPLIRLDGLTRRFGQVAAVDNLSLSVKRGEIFGLLGPDGAGKTTTLRILSGLIDPDTGGASIAGMDVTRAGESLRDVIGYMAQRFGLYGDLSIDENMAFYGDLFGVAPEEFRERTERLLRMTRMAEFRTRQAGRLSGGMKQKLALMCALLHRPQVLLLDEPTNGVDPVSRRDFWAILYELVREGVTVLVTTAYLDEAERCNRVGLIHRGKLVHCDTPEAVRSAPVEECYSLACRDRVRAREFLLGIAGIESVEPFGDVLHLFLDPRSTGPAQVHAALLGAGHDDATLSRIDPSLEDVFILLIRKAEKGS